MQVQAEAHKRQANSNRDFHSSCCSNFPDGFYDWKITVLFYTALHEIKCYFCYKGIAIGNTHEEINRNIDPNGYTEGRFPVDRNCYRDYKALYRYSQDARYSGITDPATFEKMKKNDHVLSLQHLQGVERYIERNTKRAA